MDEVFLYNLLRIIGEKPTPTKHILNKMPDLQKKGLTELSKYLIAAREANLIFFNNKDSLFSLTIKGQAKLNRLSQKFERQYSENMTRQESRWASSGLSSCQANDSSPYDLPRSNQTSLRNQPGKAYRIENKLDICRFVDLKIGKAKSTFIKFARQQKDLCELSNIFGSGTPPDYNDILVQSFYILKYYPAYLAEYLDLYNLLGKLLRNKTYEVLSVGCGCGTDFDALTYSDLAGRANWEGLDRINWEYTSQCKIIKNDFFNYVLSCRKKYNVVFFPRSADEMINKKEAFLKSLFSIPLINNENCAYVFSFANETNRNIFIDMIKKERHKIKITPIDPNKSYISTYTQGIPFPKDKYANEFKIVRSSCNNADRCNIECRLNYPISTYAYRFALIALP